MPELMIFQFTSSNLDFKPVLRWGKRANVVVAVGAVRIVCVIEIKQVRVVGCDFKVHVPSCTICLSSRGPISKRDEQMGVILDRSLVALKSYLFSVQTKLEVSKPKMSLRSPFTG